MKVPSSRGKINQGPHSRTLEETKDNPNLANPKKAYGRRVEIIGLVCEGSGYLQGRGKPKKKKKPRFGWMECEVRKTCCLSEEKGKTLLGEKPGLKGKESNTIAKEGQREK